MQDKIDDKVGYTGKKDRVYNDFQQHKQINHHNQL